MAQSIGSVLSGTTYPSDDPEMLAVEADYAAREAQLQEEIDNIESSHPGHDEYRYDLGMIGHDPHELAAFLSAVLQGYTRQSAQAELARVFAAQYQLTLTEEVEIRYRTETSTDPETGETTSEEVPYPTPTTIDTFYTNAEGYLVTPEKLEYGSGYSLVEVQAPYGYVLDSTPVYFDVTEDASSEEGGVTVIEVTKPNMAQKGVIKVSKTGEVFSTVTESNGVYQPVYDVTGLSGAVFEITALEDVYTLDGTLRYSAGEVVDTITTGEDGTAQSQPLYLGKFQVKEIEFPHGMVDTGENVTNVELVYAGQEVEITETSASFYNQRQKVQVTLNKLLEQDEAFGIGMNGEISAVTFGLYAQEEIPAADGSVIPADGLLEIVSVGENGQATCATDLPFGSFYLKELSTDSHYLLNGETFPFNFEYGGPSVAVVEITANDGEAITNELIRGEIHGLKTDENGTGLGRAVIGLFKSDESEFTAENAIATATSADDGSFSFTDVPYGNWVLKELESGRKGLSSLMRSSPLPLRKMDRLWKSLSPMSGFMVTSPLRYQRRRRRDRYRGTLSGREYRR